MGGLAPIIFFFSLVGTSWLRGGFMKENFIHSPTIKGISSVGQLNLTILLLQTAFDI